jgi:UDP-glucose 4-epimerase
MWGDRVNLVIGKQSNLSNVLQQKIDNIILISARDILANIEILAPYKKLKIRLIFNHFRPSTQLNNIENYTQYMQQAIVSTSMILDYLSPTLIEKIIYTSSSSVYGSNRLCQESDILKPINLHASLKISNEKIIESYSQKYNIDYTITRIFNMYGGDDKFSIISKIIDAYENNKILTIVNNGSAIRDFIHIDNVVEAYSKLLFLKNIPIMNIGKGEGNSVQNILQFLEQNGIYIKTNNIIREEIKLSTADNTFLKKYIGIDKFIEIESYLEERLKL